MLGCPSRTLWLPDLVLLDFCEIICKLFPPHSLANPAQPHDSKGQNCTIQSQHGPQISNAWELEYPELRFWSGLWNRTENHLWKLDARLGLASTPGSHSVWNIDDNRFLDNCRLGEEILSSHLWGESCALIHSQGNRPGAGLQGQSPGSVLRACYGKGMQNWQCLIHISSEEEEKKKRHHMARGERKKRGAASPSSRHEHLAGAVGLLLSFPHQQGRETSRVPPSPRLPLNDLCFPASPSPGNPWGVGQKGAHSPRALWEMAARGELQAPCESWLWGRRAHSSAASSDF